MGNRTIDKRSEIPGSGAKPPPLLRITDEIAAAAALVAEADAQVSGKQSRRVNKRSSFWMENISRKGTSPWADDADTYVVRPRYPVLRNVLGLVLNY